MSTVESLNRDTIEYIASEYAAASSPWVIGFSGGKDSSALLKLTFLALSRSRKRGAPVTAVYCDTGVDIPLVRSLVKKTLKGITGEAAVRGIPLSIKVLSPLLKDRYFVKVIGRGYPPPTNKFRWCTDNLRIDPVTRFLARSDSTSPTILLGLRKGESAERDKTIERHETGRPMYFRQAGASRSIIFGPLINYGADDVWGTLARPGPPYSIDVQSLASLYRRASGECPIIRDPRSSPCGQGRFGCWTCTVVRRDRALENLVYEDGMKDLKSLLEFRNWLIAMRDMPENRCRWRRNGVRGFGPLTLAARKEILRRLYQAQSGSNWTLIARREVAAIKQLWRSDRENLRYRE